MAAIANYIEKLADSTPIPTPIYIHLHIVHGLAEAPHITTLPSSSHITLPHPTPLPPTPPHTVQKPPS